MLSGYRCDCSVGKESRCPVLPCSHVTALLTWGGCAHIVPAAAHSHKPVDTGLWAALAYRQNWQLGRAWVMMLTLPWGGAAMDGACMALTGAWDGRLPGCLGRTAVRHISERSDWCSGGAGQTCRTAVAHARRQGISGGSIRS